MRLIWMAGALVILFIRPWAKFCAGKSVAFDILVGVAKDGVYRGVHCLSKTKS